MSEKNNYTVNINTKKIIANIMFTFSHSSNLIFKRVIRNLHYTHCLEI